MRLMEAHSVTSSLSVVGLSYGGFVAYSMVAQFPAVVEKVVIVSAAVCMEERDIVEGRFNVPSLEVAAELLLPQTPEKLKELMNMTLTKPPKFVPNCFLYDFIQVSYACSVFLGSITLFLFCFGSKSFSYVLNKFEFDLSDYELGIWFKMSIFVGVLEIT